MGEPKKYRVFKGDQELEATTSSAKTQARIAAARKRFAIPETVSDPIPLGEYRKARGKRAVSDYRRAVNCVLALVRGVEPSFSIAWLRVHVSQVLSMPFFSEGENSLCRVYGSDLETDVVHEVHTKLTPARAARPPKP